MVSLLYKKVFMKENFSLKTCQDFLNASFVSVSKEKKFILFYINSLA